MKTFLLTICFLSVQTGMVAIAQDKEQTPVYLDDTQPIEVRVQDALNRMTVEEKTRLSYAQGKFSSPGCPRLGIPELWMSDGPHGVRAEINWNDWATDAIPANGRKSAYLPVGNCKASALISMESLSMESHFLKALPMKKVCISTSLKFRKSFAVNRSILYSKLQ